MELGITWRWGACGVGVPVPLKGGRRSGSTAIGRFVYTFNNTRGRELRLQVRSIDPG